MKTNWNLPDVSKSMAVTYVREANLTRAVIAYLRSVPNCEVTKMHGSVMQTATLDLLVEWNGIVIWLELKAHRDKATPRQQAIIERKRCNGSIAGVVHTVAEVYTVLTIIREQALALRMGELKTWPVELELRSTTRARARRG